MCMRRPWHWFFLLIDYMSLSCQLIFLFSACSMLFFFLTKKHGGSTNAFTATEHTNYYFDVNADCFEEALDRWMLLSVSFLLLISSL